MIDFFLIYFLCLLGFLHICFSMSRHQQQVFQKALQAKHNIWYLVTGYSILVIALALSIYHWGGSIGICYWIGILSFAALLIIWLLSYYPLQLKLVNQFLRVIILVLFVFDLLA
ncbi:DUF3325 domain-containing protein [Acinetobacter lactucae]|uniref:DUF3325 domain-containing protein n=1 Tax=Acinetobacter lactucae TaxID=1785128 RepID=UPI00077E2A2D|nr:DUF3325 domain-containing protein [Acinetobacter lactucae]